MANEDEQLVSIPEFLLTSASDWLEAAQIYLTALIEISNAAVEGDEAKSLQEKARTAIQNAGNAIILPEKSAEASE